MTKEQRQYYTTITKAFDEIYECYKAGKEVYLGCFCAPKPCHADVIARKLQQKLIREKMEERKKRRSSED